MAKTAVVILNYNGSDFLKKFLPILIRHTPDAELIVADNASTDDSRTVLNSFPEIQTIYFEENYGFAGGYNQAIERVDAQYIVLLNSDVEVTEGWLAPLLSVLDLDHRVAACQPKIKSYYNKDYFEYAGACGGFIDSLGYPYCRGRIFDTQEEDHGQYDQPMDVFWTSGACMIIRRSAYVEAGGFDADFFAHMEEIDLCWRLHSSDYTLRVIPSSTVYHVGGGTLSKENPFKTYLNFRNNLFLLLKNLPFLQLVWKLPTRLVLDWIAALKFLSVWKPRHALAIGKAHIHFLSRWKTNWSKRNRISKPDSNLFILALYYVLRKKRFSRLK